MARSGDVADGGEDEEKIDLAAVSARWLGERHRGVRY